jgi:hypothetical protein
MRSALDSAIGLPNKSTSAFSMLPFVTPGRSSNDAAGRNERVARPQAPDQSPEAPWR